MKKRPLYHVRNDKIVVRRAQLIFMSVMKLIFLI